MCDHWRAVLTVRKNRLLPWEQFGQRQNPAARYSFWDIISLFLLFQTRNALRG